MRLATFNVENMFERSAAMNLPSWSDGRQVLEDFAELNDLIARSRPTCRRRRRGSSPSSSVIPRLLTQGVSTILRLRELRGKLVRTSGQPHEIAVNGRDDWIGWFELVEDQLNAIALVSTARIVTLLAADMFCVIEADNRLPLTRFSATVIKQVGGTPYDHVMLVDGTDDRDRRAATFDWPWLRTVARRP